MCQYLHSKIPPERCGLWSCFPPGKEHYRGIIVETFGHVFLNDHSRDDIIHKPILVSSQELNLEPWARWYMTDHCWVQNYWSASINPNGVFFCEVAGALAMLTGGMGWEVDGMWWTKSPMDYVSQMETYCPMCGCAMPIQARNSTEGVDDVSPKMLELLKSLESPKVSRGRYSVHDLAMGDDTRQAAAYKDIKYRDTIADRYGIFLVVNGQNFQTPFLKRKWRGDSP